MPYINRFKINNVKEMLMKCFYGCDRVYKHTLEERVESDTIAVALRNKFIILNREQYVITNRGKDYRDKN